MTLRDQLLDAIKSKRLITTCGSPVNETLANPDAHIVLCMPPRDKWNDCYNYAHGLEGMMSMNTIYTKDGGLFGGAIYVFKPERLVEAAEFHMVWGCTLDEIMEVCGR